MNHYKILRVQENGERIDDALSLSYLRDFLIKVGINGFRTKHKMLVKCMNISLCLFLIFQHKSKKESKQILSLRND